jgi:hypothetical protein
MQHTDIHPDAVYQALLDAGGHTTKLKNLRLVHEGCRRQHERNSRDFSLRTIGKYTEEQGGLSWRSIYNTVAYVKLIEAWEAYAGPSDPTPRVHKKPPVALAFLARIEDPAIRSIMEGVIIERDKLLKENNLLRTLPRGIIDKRPLGATIVYTEDAQSVAVLNIGARLTESERSALRKAVDADVLADSGWVEGSHGEILNDRGRTLFDVGFATAIRKVLEDK